MTLHITYQYTIMLLNRPLYQRLLHKDPEHTSVKSCDAAALKVVELLGVSSIWGQYQDIYYLVTKTPCELSFTITSIPLITHLYRAYRPLLWLVLSIY